MVPFSQIWLSAIAAEEILAGRLGQINKARAKNSVVSMKLAYQGLAESIKDLADFRIYPYTIDDEQEFDKLSAKLKRNGGNDCRIAVNAMRSGMTVVTSNKMHFEAIGVTCEDWSRD